ncbi:DNA (cytosine-5-)-methyltransferase [Lachnoclostridium sp.]|uniref:DNA (cytosine-5-)-methyltransferase n=1 Tax=Lachnoclostridium sp. TaxID=2028282 RepID=UPI00289FB408|nr:DNA (cytosine-5-)-methyltransferase [Lachnoclostridium sp.]
MTATMDLKIAQLRKRKGVSQQELADFLGVTFQSVSKWETKTTLPDITLLPLIADYFQVSVDELLGLKPIKDLQYMPRNTDNREKWEDRADVIENDRQFFWNEDYLRYLITEVWAIKEPIDVIEFCCCDGDLGKRILPLLPAGSTYTGVDSESLIEKARKHFNGSDVSYICSDIYHFKTERKYHLSICQATLRHMNYPLQILETMKESVLPGGLVVCVEINREIENVGFYAEGLKYDSLCTSFDWRKLWLKELECEGRDYAIGMRLPFLMREIGLKDVDVRMNDKVSFITPDSKGYEKLCNSFRTYRGFHQAELNDMSEQGIEFFMSRGYQRSEVEKLTKFQIEVSKYFTENQGDLSFLFFFGFLISFGRR